MVNRLRRAAEDFLYSSINWIGGIKLAFIAVYIGFQIGPAIEQKVNPVVADFHLTSIESYGTGTVFTFEFEKLRDCQFVGLEIFPTDVIFSTGKRPRKLNNEEVSSNPPGKFASNQWLVEAMDAHRFKNHAAIYWQHRCHPFWMTRTMVYP